MGFGEFLDGLIAPFAPATAARRIGARQSLTLLRNYEAGRPDKRNPGRRAPRSDGNAANQRGLLQTRAMAWDLYRNNKTARAGVKQRVAAVVGDGIKPQFIHADAAVQELAQSAWDRWAEAPVNGDQDFYSFQSVAFRTTVVGGEMLTIWKPAGRKPDQRIEGIEGDQLDFAKTQDLADGGTIVQGVEFDSGNDRAAYWMFDRHPGGVQISKSMAAQRIDARHIDHLFERERFGQVRGTSWLASVLLDLMDIAEIQRTALLQQKIQTCLGLIFVPGENGGTSAVLDASNGQLSQDGASPGQRLEQVTPGMMYRAERGDTVHTLTPTAPGGAVQLMQHVLAGVSATLSPYFLMTGDTSGATYSNLRAAMLGHWPQVVDAQQNVLIPHLIAPAVRRRLRVLALEARDPRVLDCAVSYALPKRELVDPIKDLAFETMEIRAGLKSLTKALHERGLNPQDHFADLGKVAAILDSLGLILDTDPRHVTQSGVMQKLHETGAFDPVSPGT